MNYKQSTDIFNRIKSCESVVITCHINPDPDSIASALALAYTIKDWGKKVEIICESPIPEIDKFIDGTGLIQTIDFNKYNFSKFDLLIIPDTGSKSNFSKTVNWDKLKIARICIDHHASNPGGCNIQLVEKTASSTTEILYFLFQDWKVETDNHIASLLMLGIIGDTGCFKYSNTTAKTLLVASKLTQLGADKNNIIKILFMTHDFALYEYWAEVLSRMEFDKAHGIVYSAIPYSVYQNFETKVNITDIIGTAGEFFSQVKTSRIGIYIVELAKNMLKISFRTREDSIDASQLARLLGGGGHSKAAGTSIENMPFNEAVEQVLATTREFIK